MKTTKLILSTVLVWLVIPIFAVTLLSFKNTQASAFGWYIQIVHDSTYLDALGLSTLVSLTTAIISTALAFVLSLSWFNKRQFTLVVALVFALGLLPADILALSISKSAQLVGFYGSNIAMLIVGLILYCIPFGIVIFWVQLYTIKPALIISAQDIGLTNAGIARKVILPLSGSAITACILFCFLLSFNEYPRTFYLSGANEFLSEFLNGKLSSGADPSIYAGASAVVFITFFVVIAIGLIFLFRSRRSSRRLASTRVKKLSL